MLNVAGRAPPTHAGVCVCQGRRGAKGGGGGPGGGGGQGPQRDQRIGWRHGSLQGALGGCAHTARSTTTTTSWAGLASRAGTAAATGWRGDPGNMQRGYEVAKRVK